MKKNIILLIILSGFLLAVFAIGLFMLRDDMKFIIQEAEKEIRFFPVEVTAFNSLDFPANWKVKIRQGRKYTVEFSEKSTSMVRTAIEKSDGKVFLRVDPVGERIDTLPTYARITMPIIGVIKAGMGSQIQIENFTSDSIRVILENGCVFEGKNNTFKQTDFKTSGEVCIRLNNIMTN